MNEASLRVVERCFDAVVAQRDCWRKALEEIRDADPVDMALDPNWAARIAREALEGPVVTTVVTTRSDLREPERT